MQTCAGDAFIASANAIAIITGTAVVIVYINMHVHVVGIALAVLVPAIVESGLWKLLVMMELLSI
jgi:hypothetical protein